MYINLIINFNNTRRMTEEPQGGYLEFETFKEFVDFTREQMSDIVEDWLPEGKEVIQKLKSGDFTLRGENDYIDVFVSVKSITSMNEKFENRRRR